MNIEGNIARTTVSDAVFRRLSDQILSADAEVGAALPSERTLSETFGVNRHAVREAIKRLQQAGLVTVIHGGATRVTDWRGQCGPDLLVALGAGLDQPDRVALSQQIVGARRAILETIAAGAATVQALPADFGSRFGRGGEDRISEYRRLLSDIAQGSGNVAAQLTLNSLSTGLDALGQEGLAVFEAEAGRDEQIQALISAIGSADAGAAQAAAAALAAPAPVFA